MKSSTSVVELVMLLCSQVSDCLPPLLLPMSLSSALIATNHIIRRFFLYIKQSDAF